MNKNDKVLYGIWIVLAILISIIYWGISYTSSSGSSYNETKSQSQQDRETIEKAGQQLDDIADYEESQGR